MLPRQASPLPFHRPSVRPSPLPSLPPTLLTLASTTSHPSITTMQKKIKDWQQERVCVYARQILMSTDISAELGFNRVHCKEIVEHAFSSFLSSHIAKCVMGDNHGSLAITCP